MPDYRIQKYNDWTKRYSDMYLLDNSIQLDYAIEDFEYTKWLDQTLKGAYRNTTEVTMSVTSQLEKAEEPSVRH